MLHLGGKTILYVGGLFFVFLVAFILYEFKDPIVFLVLLIVSGSFNLLWYIVILDSKKYTLEQYQINETEDKATPYITYMTSYISVLPLIQGGVYGLLAFLVILLIFYSVYINSDIIYYNPFLAMAGYKYFRVTVSDGNEIYLISKDSIKSGQIISVYKITDYIYLAA